ncbi:MAG TPA: hypothetical protein PLC01_03870 [Methylotenera sp.]|nr:hypothetical protein [Methylotenera sp.]
MRWLFMFLAFHSINCKALELQGEAETQRLQVKSQLQEIGYQVGDIAQQTLTINTPKGYRFDETSLPTIGKSMANIELSAANWRAKNVGDKTVHVLKLDWQIFRVSQETRAYALKPMDLQFRQDKSVLIAHVKPSHLFVASILPTALTKATAEMNAANLQPREDARPEMRNTQVLILRMIFASIGLLASSLYFAWRFDWLPAKFGKTGPFRKAYRQLQKMQKSDDNVMLLEAMRNLRRACDASAGVSLTKERLPVLFEIHPKFGSKRSEIEAFYEASERQFFAGNTSQLTIKQLIQLCRQLMALETA